MYDPDSGVTTNASEAHNSVLKREADWKEVPLDTMVLGLYYISIFYEHEILRGYCNLGDYILDKGFESFIHEAE